MQTLPETVADRLPCRAQNFGAYPIVNGQSRLEQRFYGDATALEAVKRGARDAIDAAALRSVS